MDSSLISTSSWSKRLPQTESKSVTLALRRFETCRQKVFRKKSEHTLTLILQALGFLLTRPSQVVTTTELKSVSLGLCRFETCRTTEVFLPEHTFTFTVG
jgi:hypothetical protein